MRLENPPFPFLFPPRHTEKLDTPSPVPNKSDQVTIELKEINDQIETVILEKKPQRCICQNRDPKQHKRLKKILTKEEEVPIDNV